jgi:hypothetical protein
MLPARYHAARNDGEGVEIGSGVTDNLKVGDRIACGL